MQKTTVTVLGIIIVCSVMVGCEPGYNTPGATATGAALGGLVGGEVFESGAGALGGALVGGIVGNQIGQQMDYEDAQRMQHVVYYAPTYQPTTWVNPGTAVAYTVTPVEAYHHGPQYCRQYKTKIVVNGRVQTAYGTACRNPDGTWQVVR